MKRKMAQLPVRVLNFERKPSEDWTCPSEEVEMGENPERMA